MTPSIARLVLTSRLNGDEEAGVPHESARHLKAALEELSMVDRVERALCATGYVSLRIVTISIDDRLVILRGQVPSYFLKQVAQAAALKVPGVHGVRNDLDVTRIH